MSGSDTPSLILRIMAVTVAAAAAVAFLPTSAQAHSSKDKWEQRKHIKQRAKTQRGTPYRYGGSSPRGFDCSGFTHWTFNGHGANLPHSSMQQFNLAKKKDNRRVWKRGKLKVGDLVFHKTTSARVGHVGIYIGNGKFISATSSGGVRVQSVWDPYYWGSRWVGATRLKTTR